MTITFRAVGGFGEIGRNMCAVKINDNVFIFDMGLHLQNYIEITEQEREQFVPLSESLLKKNDAIPQDDIISDWLPNVRAILTTHAHLDHMGAIPWLAHKYNAPVICSPFSAHILKSIIREDELEFENRIIELKPSKKMKIAKDVSIEFVRTTHSTPQAVIIVLHTSEGIIMYGNDFRLDKNPTLGKAPDFSRLKALGKKGVKLLIEDCLYSCKQGHTGTEKDVKEKLKNILFTEGKKNKGLIVTTFGSHIERLHNISIIGKKLGRKVFFLGRSLARYCFAAQDCKITKFDGVSISKFAKQSRRYLRQINKRGKENCLLVVTGHQGEPKASLSKMVDGLLPYKFSNKDVVVFSSSIIPVKDNEENRAILEKKLLEKGVCIYDNVHISGHCFKEDVIEFLNLVKPQNFIPAHGTKEKTDCMISLIKENNILDKKKVYVVVNGDSVTID